MAGKANQNRGGSEMGKQPHVGMESQRSTTPTQNAPAYREVPTLTMEGMALCPFKATKQK